MSAIDLKAEYWEDWSHAKEPEEGFIQLPTVNEWRRHNLCRIQLTQAGYEWIKTAYPRINREKPTRVEFQGVHYDCTMQHVEMHTPLGKKPTLSIHLWVLGVEDPFKDPGTEDVDLVADLV